MRKHLYLYLFIFASLIALIFYINGRKYQEKLEAQVTQLRNEIDKADKERKAMLSQEKTTADYNGELSSFLLSQNAEAEEYLYNSGLSVDQVKQEVTDKLLSLNLVEGGNSLVPYTGQGRGFHINNMAFVNHKWVLASFYDGDRWGEALIEYHYDQDNNLEVSTVKALLYI
jgi:hypothetical protein